MDNYYSGKCKLCNTEFRHDYNSHMFNILNTIEECKYTNVVIDHYLENHKEKYNFTSLDKIGVFLRKIIKAVLKDLLMIVVFPFSLVVSVLNKMFEWLNDRIGMF